VDIYGEPGPLPERGSRVDLTGPAGGPWAAVVERTLDGVIMLAPTDPLMPLPPTAERLTMLYPARGIPWELDVELIASSNGAAAAERSVRPAGEPTRSRRGAVRTPVRVAVAARLEGGDDDLVVAACTENISTAGALLATAEAMEVGRLLLMEMGGDGPDVPVLAGRVVRCDAHPGRDLPWRVAVAFVDLAGAEQDRLRRFLLDRGRPAGAGSG
jgi:PilZ domain